MYNMEDGPAYTAGSCWRSRGDCENFKNAPSSIFAHPFVSQWSMYIMSRWLLVCIIFQQKCAASQGAESPNGTAIILSRLDSALSCKCIPICFCRDAKHSRPFLTTSKRWNPSSGRSAPRCVTSVRGCNHLHFHPPETSRCCSPAPLAAVFFLKHIFKIETVIMSWGGRRMACEFSQWPLFV